MNQALKSLTIISIVMLMSIFGHTSKAQEPEGPKSRYLYDICKSTIPIVEGCVNFNVNKTITLKEFKECPLNVDVLVSICDGKIYLYPERIYFTNPKCKKLIERIFNDKDNSMFMSWLTKNIYYEVALLIFKESREVYPEDSYFCPEGRMYFTGFSASCEGRFIYKITKNPFCMDCDCFDDYYAYERVPCTLSGCCTFSFNICLDKETNETKVRRESNGLPVENSCDGASFIRDFPTLASYPFNPIFDHKYLIQIDPCAPVCEFDFEYGDPMPSK